MINPKNHNFKLSCLRSTISKLEAIYKISKTHPSLTSRGRGPECVS